jgi:hypothetical protein
LDHGYGDDELMLFPPEAIVPYEDLEIGIYVKAGIQAIGLGHLRFEQE